MRLGLSDKTIPLSLGEAGKRLGLKAEEIHQIELRALRELSYSDVHLQEFQHLDYLLREYLDRKEEKEEKEIVDFRKLRSEKEKVKMFRIAELNIGPFSSVNFDKIETLKKQYVYYLGINRTESRWWFFKKAALKMDIAGEIYNLPMFKMDSNAPSLNTNALRTYGRWKIDKEMSGKILEADSITIKVSYITHHSPTTWKVPSNVLNEWKQVIREKL